jgi:RHS repeat-associated protein
MFTQSHTGIEGSLSAGFAMSYRFGFNGQEKDNEVGQGIYTAQFWEYDSRIGRRWNLDPKTTMGYSDYSCFLDNPILNIDKLGDKPNKKEAAAMNAHVYGDKDAKILTGGWKVSDKKIDGVKLSDSETGLVSQLYERTKKNGKTEYAYVTAGTQQDDIKDVKADISQSVLTSKQYDLSVKNALLIDKELTKNTELSFSGHSLGGGEAASNAFATGRYAITFNASGLSNSSLLKYGFNLKTKIDSYIILTDPLNIGNYIMGEARVGTRHYEFDYSNSTLFNGHSIDNFLRIYEINPSFYQIHGGGGKW